MVEPRQVLDKNKNSEYPKVKAILAKFAITLELYYLSQETRGGNTNS